MTNRAVGTLFRRKDGQYLMHLPKTLAEDSMFPIPVHSSTKVELSFEVGDDKLTVKKATEKESD